MPDDKVIVSLELSGISEKGTFFLLSTTFTMKKEKMLPVVK